MAVATTLGAAMDVIAGSDHVGAPSLIPPPACFPSFAVTSTPTPTTCALIPISHPGSTGTGILDPEDVEVREVVVVCEQKVSSLSDANLDCSIVLDDA